MPEQWNDFRVLTGGCEGWGWERQPKMLYLAKIYFKNEGKIKTFSDKKKTKRFQH